MNGAALKFLHVVPDSIQAPEQFYLGSTKDIRGRTDYFASRGLDFEEVIAPRRSDDRLVDIISGMDVSQVSGIVFEYPIYPKTLRLITKVNPSIRLLVRAHHAEFFQRIHYLVARAKYTYGWRNVRGHYTMSRDILRRLRQDRSSARLADGVLSITSWEIDHYWKFLVGSDKSHYLPYFLPQVYANEIGPPVEKIDQCVCMMSTSRGPEAFLLDAALNLTRLVKQLGQQQRKWSFAMTGMIPERGLVLPDRIRPTGLLDSPYGILAESKAVALLSDYGFGFKTKFLEAVMSGCYVFVTEGMHKRLPPEVRQFCFEVDVNSIESFENALSRCEEPFPEVDVNGQLREIAFSVLDNALGVTSEVGVASAN